VVWFVLQQQVNNSVTQSVLRAAAGASAMLQPRKSVCANSLHRGKHTLRYTDGSIDSELPAFFQERLEDGNARRVCIMLSLATSDACAFSTFNIFYEYSVSAQRMYESICHYCFFNYFFTPVVKVPEG
jgi:hypothetical protein